MTDAEYRRVVRELRRRGGPDESELVEMLEQRIDILQRTIRAQAETLALDQEIITLLKTQIAQAGALHHARLAGPAAPPQPEVTR